MNIFKNFFITLTKPKVIIALIILTITAVLTGVLVPQVSDKSPSYFEEWKSESPLTFNIVNSLQLNRVYTSVWFLLLVFLILLSLGYSIYLQIRKNLQASRSQSTVYDKDAVGCEVKICKLTTDSLMKFMRRKGYRAAQSLEKNHNELLNINNGEELIFFKNSINRWGSVIFHTGLFLIMASAIIGLGFQKRGFVQIMEGEIFSGMDSDFLVKDLGIFVRTFDAGFKTCLSKFHHDYWKGGDLKSLHSSVIIDEEEDKNAEYDISVNNPINVKGVKVYQSYNYGYALSFLLKRQNGEQVATHFLLAKPEKAGKPAVGRYDFETTDYIFDIKFYPDITGPSFYPSKPIISLAVSEKGTMIFKGLLIPGQTIKIKDDILQFALIRSWSGLIYAKESWTTAVYTGFFIAIAGLFIMYFLTYKEIRIKRSGGSTVSIIGITKRYHAIMTEEIKNIKSEMERLFNG